MMSVFSEMLQYDFLRRALLVGFLVSLCAALLGVSLVLKRYSMIGDGLSPPPRWFRHACRGNCAWCSSIKVNNTGCSCSSIFTATAE